MIGMKKKIVWMLVSGLMVLSLVMASCGSAEVEAAVEAEVEVIEEVVEQEEEEEEEEEIKGIEMYVPLFIFSGIILAFIAGTWYVRRKF